MLKGVLASLFASAIFAGLYYYATLLTPLTGEEIFGWRLLFTAPGVTLLLLATREWRQVRATLRRIGDLGGAEIVGDFDGLHRQGGKQHRAGKSGDKRFDGHGITPGKIAPQHSLRLAHSYRPQT